MNNDKRLLLGVPIATTFIVYILGAAFEGIIGGRADALLVLLWPLAISPRTLSLWSWMIVLILCIILLIGGVFWNRTRINLSHKEKELSGSEKELSLNKEELRITDLVVEFDNELLRKVPYLVSAGNLDAEMHRLMDILLELVTVVFDGEVNRASVLLPDADRKLLKYGWGYQISDRTKQNTQFNIEVGVSGVKRGIAGEAFIDGQPHIVHLSRQNGKWMSDDEGCYVFFGSNKRSLPSLPYRSCVCVAISAGVTLADRLGVLCLDSPNLTAFDSAMVQDSRLHQRLIILAGRFANALLIYQELKSSSQSQQRIVQALP